MRTYAVLLITVKWNYLHVPDKETEARELGDLPKVSELRRDGLALRSQKLGLETLFLLAVPADYFQGRPET